MLTTIAAGRVFNFSHCLGMYAMAAQGFWDPLDFAFGKNGKMYVVNRGAEELGQRVTICTTDHEFISQFGGFGSGDGQFIWPVSIDIDSQDNVYVSDENLQRITVFDPDGKFLSKWGASGSGEGQLKGPAGIAFDQEDNLYVAESHNHRVQKFTKDGQFILQWGSQGDGDGQFNSPWGICVDHNGDVYVADWKNNRVQKFSAQGQYLRQFKATPNGGDLNRPTGVAVDADGDVYVTDWGNHQVQIYGPDGEFVTTLEGDAQTPSPWTQTYLEANPEIIKQRRRVNLEPEWRFRRPVAVNIDSDGNIYIAESVRHRFQIYQKEKDYEEPALNL
ncbi:MAG: NHL repeat-containing protein [Chloroflexi bacterium]|nr:NHL repeat-containing protein [Chloroflexota bacterium]